MSEISLDAHSSQSQLDNYESYSKKGNWLVRYHASWCGHCISMSQEWSNFVLNNKNKKIKIASIEQEAMDKLKKFPLNFKGFPSIIFFKDGQFVSEFNNERTEQKLHQFIKINIKHNKYRISNKKKRQSISGKSMKLSQKVSRSSSLKTKKR